MSEEKEKTGNQETTVTPDKTFTQAELDAIIADRLKRERDKFSDYDALKEKAGKYDEDEEKSKSELQKITERSEELQKKVDKMTHDADVRKVREKISNELSVPIGLLSGENDDVCRAQAKSILEFAKPGNYKPVKDAGEPPTPTTTKEEIMKITDERQRIKAIEENIALFRK